MAVGTIPAIFEASRRKQYTVFDRSFTSFSFIYVDKRYGCALDASYKTPHGFSTDAAFF